MTGRTWLTRRAMLHGVARWFSAVALLGTRSRALAAVPAAQAGESRSKEPMSHWQTIVIGAGAFGAWTAWNLRRKGQRVLLLDAWGPAHARASSGGESRVTRTAYGADEVYTRMALESLREWQWLSGRSGLPIFHPTGVLFFFTRGERVLAETLEVHRRLKLPTEALDHATLSKRFPQIAWDGIDMGLYEPQFGALMARRAVQTLVSEYVKAGGEYRTDAIAPPDGTNGPLKSVRTVSGEQLSADTYIFACGPWLPKLFPDVLGSRIFPTRQEVFFFAPEPGDKRYAPPALPVWADFNNGDMFYGMPDLEARGFKIAHDRHGPPIDPDTGDRHASLEGLADVRAFMSKRFPALAARPMIESRVCQYENSSNGDLLIDRHPRWSNVWLVGAGSGHGFKHGPAVGSYTADLISGSLPKPEPRFSLASKASVQQRTVH